jgi:hypothetical protein
VKDHNGCSVSDTVLITRPPFLSVIISFSINEKCNGNTNARASAVASGGTGAYTYAWTPSGGSTANATGLSAGEYTITVTDAKGCTGVDSVNITQPPPIKDSLIADTNVTCNGLTNGSATIGVNGGTPGYAFFWSNGSTNSSIANVGAGTYTVNIRDANGCTSSATVTITQPAQLRDSITASFNVMCFGNNNGSATVGVAGGTMPYAYNWSPGGNTNATASNLTAGSYTVTISDSNGCTATANVTLTQPATALADSTLSVSASCGKSNGSAMVYAYNGSPGYKYSWSNGNTTTSVTGIAAGTYTCTITDANGCSVSPVVIIKDSSNLAGTITLLSEVSCHGDCNGGAEVTVTGGTAPYTYLWTGGSTTTSANTLCAGLNSIVTTDSKGCVVTDTMTITQPAVLTVVIDSDIIGACNNSAWAMVNGGTKSYTYLWSNGQTGDTATSLCSGTYTVTVTDAHGCVTDEIITIVVPAGIEELQNNTSFKLYPVPSNGTLNINVNGAFVPQSVMVYDVTGRELINQKISQNTGIITMDVSKLDYGNYILILTDRDGKKLEARFTVAK